MLLADGSKTPSVAATVTASTSAAANVKPSKATKLVSQASVAASEKKGGGERLPEKERKKEVPHPRMQYDDTSRVEKAKRRSVVKQTEARNRVELFRHLPQYEHGTQLPDLESKFFQLDPVHPAVYKVHYISLLWCDYDRDQRVKLWFYLIFTFCTNVRLGYSIYQEIYLVGMLVV